MSCDNWRKVTIKDICDVGSSKRIYRKEYVEKGIPFYRSKEIILKHNNQSIDDSLYISKERFDEIDMKFGSPSAGDILLTSVGTLGVPYQVKSHEKFYFKDGNLTWFKNYEKDLYPKFLYYWLFSSVGQKAIDDISIGSTQRAITIKGINTIEIDLPPLKEQKVIANILSSLDDKIELNNKINRNLEEMAQALYKQWFVDFEFPNEVGEPYKSSGGEMIESELGLIPKGWEVMSLDELSAKEKHSIVDGPFGTQMKVAEYTDHGVPIIEMKYLKGSELENKFDNYITEEKYDVVKRSTVRPGDIIISKTGTLGLLGYLPKDVKKAILVSRLAKITPDLNILGTYTLLLIFKYMNKIGHWYQIASGSTMPLLNMGLIKNTKIVFTTENKITESFERINSSIYEQINNNVKQIRELKKLRDTLLPRLMSGEIEVPIEG